MLLSSPGVGCAVIEDEVATRVEAAKEGVYRVVRVGAKGLVAVYHLCACCISSVCECIVVVGLYQWLAVTHVELLAQEALNL